MSQQTCPCVVPLPDRPAAEKPRVEVKSERVRIIRGTRRRVPETPR